MSQSGNPWGGPGGGYPPGAPGPTVPGDPWFAPQPPGYPPGYTPMASGGGVVAWEDKSLGLFARWWGTFKEVCFNSKRFHIAASQSDDPWPAVTFAVTSGAIAGLVSGLFFGIIYLALGGIGALTAASKGGHGAGPAAAVFGVLAAVGVGLVIALPLFFMFMELVGPWILGGLQHMALVMVGGATRPYSSTVRVVGYSAGAIAFYCVPIMGGTIAFGLRIVSQVIGFDETHKCGSAKAMFAAIFPYALICLCYCGCYVVLGAVGFMGGFR